MGYEQRRLLPYSGDPTPIVMWEASMQEQGNYGGPVQVAKLLAAAPWGPLFEIKDACCESLAYLWICWGLLAVWSHPELTPVFILMWNACSRCLVFSSQFQLDLMVV